VVPCIPSGCSERAPARWALAAAVLGLALAATLPVQPLPAWTQQRWRQAAFPVSRFLGYTSRFGSRSSGETGQGEPHTGLDIAAPMGSPVRNWWGGVVQAVIDNRSCGFGLVIRSGDYEHTYCHLAGRVDDGVYRSGAAALRAGTTVRVGQLLGHVGMSGRSTGPHLHWAVRWRGRWLDPALILRAMAAARDR